MALRSHRRALGARSASWTGFEVVNVSKGLINRAGRCSISLTYYHFCVEGRPGFSVTDEAG